jgi:hypothetical protein
MDIEFQQSVRAMQVISLVVVRVAAWIWALVAGVGGLMLLIKEGPLPVTNGWFAMFSGIAACPLTARRCCNFAASALLAPMFWEMLVAN